MGNDNTYLYPWVRKGIANKITEKDTLGPVNDDELHAALRPKIQVTTKMRATPVVVDKNDPAPEPIPISETKDVSIVGPADIRSVSGSAIMRSRPEAGSNGFPADCYPYIEFWEPDFLWRYTPSSPDGNRLRPWLALVVCEESRCKVQKNNEGVSIVTFNLDETSYAQTFPSPKDIWKAAHAQGLTDQEAEFCRLIGLRSADKLEVNTKYMAFLIPVFETGRLSGLGYDSSLYNTMLAQTPAWEDSLEGQRTNHQDPLRFPAYYTWKFTTGIYSFDELVSMLSPYAPAKSGIAVDVTHMGEGLDYDALKTRPKQTEINIPAATKIPGTPQEPAFPARTGDQAQLYTNLKDLISKNPVFAENYDMINTDGKVTSTQDDPWIVPPVYGAKHVMATSLEKETPEEKKFGVNNEWMREINLDIHYRSAAGLGKKVVQRHQEEFVNRAWKQVELVQLLNRELYKKIASIRTNSSIKGKQYPWLNDASGSKFVSNLMMNLASMKNTKAQEGVSIASLMNDMGIPQAFATATFQKVSDQLSQHIAGLDSASIMEKIAKDQIYVQKTPPSVDSPDIAAMKKVSERLFCESVIPILAPHIANGTDVKKRFDPYGGYFRKPFIRGEIKPINTLQMTFLSHLEMFMNTMRGVNRTVAGIFGGLDKYLGEVDSYMPSGRVLNADMFNRTISSANNTEDQHVVSLRNAIRFLGGVNLIGLSDTDYDKAFGSQKLFTKLGDKEYYCYFPIQRLMQRLPVERRLRNMVHVYMYLKDTYTSPIGETLTIRPETPEGKPLPENFTHYYSMFYADGTPFRPTHYRVDGFDNSRRKVRIDYATMRYDYLYDPDKWLFPVDSDRNSKNFQLTHAHTKKVELFVDKFFSIPDFVLVNEELLSDPTYCQSFRTPEDYIKGCREFFYSMNASSMVVWKSFDDAVSALKPAKTEKVVEIKTSQMGKKIQERLLDDESYERIIEIASKYYKKFLSSKKMQEDYIESLLMTRYPIMAYPQFPEPTYYYLKGISDKFILPAIDELPDNSISMFENDSKFVESYLAGMNTEMGRELLWREYPTDQRGSYFKKFWDSDNDEKSMEDGSFFDVKDIHTWNSSLGKNHVSGKAGLVIFAVKGELMKQYPDTQIYLQRVAAKTVGGKTTLSLEKDKAGKDTGIILPLSQAFLRDDIYIIGFQTDVATLVGDPRNKQYGYMMVFKQIVENLDFVTDESDKNQMKALDSAADSATYADALIDKPTIFARHIISFIK